MNLNIPRFFKCSNLCNIFSVQDSLLYEVIMIYLCMYAYMSMHVCIIDTLNIYMYIWVHIHIFNLLTQQTQFVRMGTHVSSKFYFLSMKQQQNFN